MREWVLIFEHQPSFGRISVYVTTEKIHKKTWITVKGFETTHAPRAAVAIVNEAARPWPDCQPTDLQLISCTEL